MDHDYDLKSVQHALPAMTTPAEQMLYDQVASEITGAGCIVDLGTWLGSTTRALARGLTKPVMIHAYDRYIWEQWMEKSYPGRYKPGESFLPEYEAHIQRWKDKIVVHPGDLCEQKWTGEPIEVLLVDAMKTMELANTIRREFFAALIPGAHLLHQDFFHFYTAWIHPMQYRLREYFEQLGSANATYHFKCIKTPPDYMLSEVSFDDFSEAETEEAFTWSRRLANQRWQGREIEMARRCWKVHKDIAHNVSGASEEMLDILAFYGHAARPG